MLVIHKIIDNGMEIIVMATDIVGLEILISSESFLILAMVMREKKCFCNTKTEN